MKELRRLVYDETRGARSIGKLLTASDEGGSVEYTYSASGLPIQKRRVYLDGTELSISLRYNTLGQVIWARYPDGEETEISYHPSGFVRAVGKYVDNIEYDSDGRIVRTNYVNGCTAAFEYDTAGNSINVTHALRSGEVVFKNATVVSKDNRSISTVSDSAMGQFEKRYAFDEYNRIDRLYINGEESKYVYDRVGNVLRRTGPSLDLSYSASIMNRPLAIRGTVNGSMTHDVCGRVTHAPHLGDLDWSPLGQLRRLTTSSGSVVELVYGHDGTRITKNVVDQGIARLTRYFDDCFEISGGMSRTFITAGGLVVGAAEKAGLGVERFTFHMDQLGNVVAVTNSDGELRESLSYGLFGNASKQSPFVCFAGERFDPDLKLYNYGVRHLDPVLGRFLTPDPLIIANPEEAFNGSQLFSSYAYALNNPLRFRDPSGRFPVLAVVVGVVIGAVIGYNAARERGSDPLAGALIGGLIGGLTGGFGGWAALATASKSAAISVGIGLITQQGGNLWTAAAVGFAFGALGATIGDWKPVAGEGFWIDLQNASMEIAIDAGTAGLRSGVTTLWTENDFWKGFQDGAKWGAIMSTLHIAAFGVRYDPLAGKDALGSSLKSDVESNYRWDSLNVDRSHLAGDLQTSGMPSQSGISFRRHGLLPMALGGRSIVIGNNVNMSSGQEYNAKVLAHELRHIGQQQALTFGFIEFLARYAGQALSPSWQYRYQDSPSNTTYETPHGF